MKLPTPDLTMPSVNADDDQGNAHYYRASTVKRLIELALVAKANPNWCAGCTPENCGGCHINPGGGCYVTYKFNGIGGSLDIPEGQHVRVVRKTSCDMESAYIVDLGNGREGYAYANELTVVQGELPT